MSHYRSSDPAGGPYEPSSHMTTESFVHKLTETSGAVQHLEKELHMVKERMEEMNAFYKVQLSRAGLAEMEHFYKDKLQKERAAVKESKEELKSFKDRVAGDINLSIKTADLESMNSPVNTTRLKEMDEELKLQWNKVKKYLRSTGSSISDAEAHIQQQFEAADRYMEGKKLLIQKLFDLGPLTSGVVPQKVIQYRQLCVQNLQLAVFHSRKEAAPQQPHSEHRVESKQDVEDFFTQCFWLHCLMALNDPPLPQSWRSQVSTRSF